MTPVLAQELICLLDYEQSHSNGIYRSSVFVVGKTNPYGMPLFHSHIYTCRETLERCWVSRTGHSPYVFLTNSSEQTRDGFKLQALDYVFGMSRMWGIP